MIINNTPYQTLHLLAKAYGSEYPYLEEHTYNYQLGIQGTEMTSQTDREVSLIVIGNNGYSDRDNPEQQNDESSPISSVPERDPLKVTLYNHLPLRMVEVGTPLSVTEIDRYRLSRIETHNDISYQVFYGLTITNTLPITLGQGTIGDIQNTDIASVFSMSQSYADDTTPPIVTNSVTQTVDFDAQLQAYFVDAVVKKYGSPAHSVIQEIGILSARETTGEVEAALLLNSFQVTPEAQSEIALTGQIHLSNTYLG